MDPVRFGKYRVLRRIASGGMAQVYLCRLTGEEGFRKRVALKVVHPRHGDDPRFRDLFVREARLAASLSHPNLVEVFDFGREGSAFFLAMEYVEGFDMAQAAAHARQLGVRIPGGVWRLWVEGIWSGLSYLHEKGIVHRDVSPGNVLLGRTGVVKLSDFGVSRAVSAGRDGGDDGLAGKAGYLSPERARGEEATASSDLFAAAVISAELLLGRRMFEGGREENPLDRVREFDGSRLDFPGTDPGLADALRTGLASDPGNRYRSATEFLEILPRVAPARATGPELADFWDALFPRSEEEETVPSLPPGDGMPPAMVKESPERYGMRGRRLQAGAAAAFVALSVGGALLWKETREGDRHPSSPAAAVAPGPTAPSSTPEVAAVASPPVKDVASASIPGMRDTGKVAEVRAEPKSFVPPTPDPPAPRYVRIETEPEGANIVAGSGETVATTPAQIDLASVGPKGIVLSRAGYERKAVPAGALTRGVTFRIELDPVIGTVEAIQAIPWAKVFLGTKFLGETPLTSVRLPVGEHRLRFVNEPLGLDRTETVVVRPGANPKVIVPLTGAGRR